MKTQSGRAEAGRMVLPQPEDRYRYQTTGSYTPARLTALFHAANTGDIEQLCLCGREILERNWDIIGALEQRSDALCGLEWDVVAGDGREGSREAAEAFAHALANAGLTEDAEGRPETFQELLPNLVDAVVLPFTAAEILWAPGGELLGFQTVEPHFFTLRESLFPRLITDEHPEGLELPRNKFIVHQFRRKPDPARAGKIRVLAWLHCLQNWPLKDLFSFIERFGMPFVVARVDQNTWDNEREVLKNVIRSFGPDGGGVFTNSTEIQLLNAANTGGDNVYFRALEFTHNAIYTLLVGQLASSGDSSGMSNGDAQTAVRQDILEADARAVEATIRAQVAAPWTRFHYGDRAAAPLLRFKVRPPEDEKAVADKALVKAQTVQTLAAAGYVIPAEEIQKVFGYTVEYHEPMQGNQMPLSGLAEPAGPEEPDAHTLNLKTEIRRDGRGDPCGTFDGDSGDRGTDPRGARTSGDVARSAEGVGGDRRDPSADHAEDRRIGSRQRCVGCEGRKRGDACGNSAHGAGRCAGSVAGTGGGCSGGDGGAVGRRARPGTPERRADDREQYSQRRFERIREARCGEYAQELRRWKSNSKSGMTRGSSTV